MSHGHAGVRVSKRTLGDLALFGGPPVSIRSLSVGRPGPVDRTRLFERLTWALDNQWLSNDGPLCREFEDRVGELAGVRHCVSTCNGTAALQLLARALDLTGEVVMPSLTFVATAHAMRWLGLEPVFCDIDPVTADIDPAAAAASIGERTSAVLGVHLWGRPCDIDALAAAAGTRPLLFDAAHAVGCTHGGRPIGGFGTAEVFSFHTTKVVGAFEGGAVLTDDDALAADLRSLRNFGIGAAVAHAHGGTNAKLSEAAAAMGLTALEALPDAIVHNEAVLARYRTELADVPGLTLRRPPAGERSNHQYVVVEIDDAVTGLDRDLLRQVLAAEQIMARPYFAPACHEQEPYRSRRPTVLPHTERLTRRVLALPTGPTVSGEDVRRVAAVIRFALLHGADVTQRWRRITVDPRQAGGPAGGDRPAQLRPVG